MRSPARSDASGQALVDYSLVLPFVAIVFVAALTFFGTQVSTLLTAIASGF